MTEADSSSAASSSSTLPSEAKSVFKDSRVWWLLLFPLVSLSGYAIARPSVESLFVEAYSAKALPYGWLAVAVAALATVSLYNRALGRYSLGEIIPRACGIFAVVLVVLWLGVWSKIPGAQFFLYVWKDTYVVVLVEIFWSFANATFALKSARWLYGAFCAMGALGGVLGSWWVGLLSDEVGALYSPLFALPSLVACGLIGIALQGGDDVKIGKTPKAEKSALGETSEGSFTEGLRVLRKSDYLAALLLVILLVQVVVNLVDFQFQSYAEQLFPDASERQKMTGSVYGYVEGVALILQLLTFVIVRALGVGGTLRSIPILLGAGLVGFLVAPSFLVMGVVKVASKSLDYSLNRAVKEMLYLPLSIEEKTAGKSIVDMLTYRMSKGIASLLAIGLGTFGVGIVEVTWANLFLVSLWFIAVGVVIRNYRLVLHRNKNRLIDDDNLGIQKPTKKAA